MAFVRADEFQFSFLLLSSSSVFQLGFGSGRTFFKFPNIAKPCSLAVILTKSVTQNKNMKKIIYLFLIIFTLSCNSNKHSQVISINAELTATLESYYNERMKLFPMEATYNGDTSYNHLLPAAFFISAILFMPILCGNWESRTSRMECT